MNEEFKALAPDARYLVRDTIRQARDGGAAEQYLGPNYARAQDGQDGTQWTIDGPNGYCIARGIWPKDQPV
jgi:hypothetical protein